MHHPKVPTYVERILEFYEEFYPPPSHKKQCTFLFCAFWGWKRKCAKNAKNAAMEFCHQHRMQIT